MTNHPNRSNIRYFKVSPRGFANEVIYFRVREHEVAEVEARFANFEDHADGGHCGWTDDKAARMPDTAVDWADRAYAGF
jgi:hypothetical protein